MYDAHDKKMLELPDVYTLENHEDYITFSHADVVANCQSKLLTVDIFCPRYQTDSGTLTSSLYKQLSVERGYTYTTRLVCTLWGG